MSYLQTSAIGDEPEFSIVRPELSPESARNGDMWHTPSSRKLFEDRSIHLSRAYSWKNSSPGHSHVNNCSRSQGGLQSNLFSPDSEVISIKRVVDQGGKVLASVVHTVSSSNGIASEQQVQYDQEDPDEVKEEEKQDMKIELEDFTHFAQHDSGARQPDEAPRSVEHASQALLQSRRRAEHAAAGAAAAACSSAAAAASSAARAYHIVQSRERARAILGAGQRSERGEQDIEGCAWRQGAGSQSPTVCNGEREETSEKCEHKENGESDSKSTKSKKRGLPGVLGGGATEDRQEVEQRYIELKQARLCMSAILAERKAGENVDVEVHRAPGCSWEIDDGDDDEAAVVEEVEVMEEMEDSGDEENDFKDADIREGPTDTRAMQGVDALGKSLRDVPIQESNTVRTGESVWNSRERAACTQVEPERVRANLSLSLSGVAASPSPEDEEQLKETETEQGVRSGHIASKRSGGGASSDLHVEHPREADGVTHAPDLSQTQARVVSLQRLEMMMEEQQDGWRSALNECREEHQQEKTTLLRELEDCQKAMEAQEERHRAEMTSIQAQLHRSLEDGARVAARLDTLLFVAQSQAADPKQRGGGVVWYDNRSGNAMESTESSQDRSHSPWRGRHPWSDTEVRESERMKAENAELTKQLRTLAESNLSLANQVDLLRCAAEEAICAADSAFSSTSAASGAAAGIETLDSVEQQLMALQDIVLQANTAASEPACDPCHSPQGLSDSRRCPGRTEQSDRDLADELSESARPELAQLREACASKDAEVTGLKAALEKSNRLLDDMCQIDQEWRLQSRSDRERGRVGDGPAQAQVVSINDLVTAQAKTAALWKETAALWKENRDLSQALRSERTANVMVKFQRMRSSGPHGGCERSWVCAEREGGGAAEGIHDRMQDSPKQGTPASVVASCDAEVPGDGIFIVRRGSKADNSYVGSRPPVTGTTLKARGYTYVGSRGPSTEGAADDAQDQEAVAAGLEGRSTGLERESSYTIYRAYEEERLQEEIAAIKRHNAFLLARAC